MDAPVKRVAKSTKTKTWGVMDGTEKVIFVAKLTLMFASFGWIYGNTLAPDNVD